MIEIVYDKTTAEKNGKNEMHYKMPKNIRQIGNAPDKKKIYIEDYVMTFLRKIAEPGNTTSRGAILLGEYFKDGDTETLFISGAVEAQNLEFDVDQIKFDDHIWAGFMRRSTNILKICQLSDGFFRAWDFPQISMKKSQDCIWRISGEGIRCCLSWIP